MGLLLLNGKPVEKPPKLPTTHGEGGRARVGRPLKPAPLKAAIVEPEPIVLPMQNLELVPLAVAEDEETRSKRVQIEGLTHQDRQAVDRLAQVGAAAGQVHPIHTCEAA